MEAILKIQIFMSGKTGKILKKSQGILLVKKSMNPAKCNLKSINHDKFVERCHMNHSIKFREN